MKALLIALVGLMMFAVPASATPEDETPKGVQQAVALRVPTYEKDVPAVVLVNESTTSIGSDGCVNNIYNFAVRILRREGREFAVAVAHNVPDASRSEEHT